MTNNEIAERIRQIMHRHMLDKCFILNAPQLEDRTYDAHKDFERLADEMERDDIIKALELKP